METSPIILDSSRLEFSLPVFPRGLVFGSIAFLTLLISFSFTLLGAWPILPFAGLECLGLYIAWRWMELHEGDYENIRLENHFLIIERKYGNFSETRKINIEWLQVILEDRRPGCRMTLFLRSHGEDLEIGKFLGDNGKIILAGKIRRILSERKF